MNPSATPFVTTSTLALHFVSTTGASYWTFITDAGNFDASDDLASAALAALDEHDTVTMRVTLDGTGSRATAIDVLAGELADRPVGCACAFHKDGSVTTSLCPLHADTDPCWTMARVTGKRRKGTIRRGVCSTCGHDSNR